MLKCHIVERKLHASFVIDAQFPVHLLTSLNFATSLISQLKLRDDIVNLPILGQNSPTADEIKKAREVGFAAD